MQQVEGNKITSRVYLALPDCSYKRLENKQFLLISQKMLDFLLYTQTNSKLLILKETQKRYLMVEELQCKNSKYDLKNSLKAFQKQAISWPDYFPLLVLWNKSWDNPMSTSAWHCLLIRRTSKQTNGTNNSSPFLRRESITLHAVSLKLCFHPAGDVNYKFLRLF